MPAHSGIAGPPSSPLCGLQGIAPDLYQWEVMSTHLSRVSPDGHRGVRDALQASCLLHQFAFGQPLQLGDASQCGAPGRRWCLASPGSSVLHRCYRDPFPPLSPSPGYLYHFFISSAFYTLLSGCFEMHLVSKVLCSCNVNPVLLELHRVTVEAPGKIGEHELWLSLVCTAGPLCGTDFRVC